MASLRKQQMSPSLKTEHKFSEEYQEYLQLKTNNQTQSSFTPIFSIAYISQSANSQSPWIIDSGAFDHISDNDSLFSSMSPKFSHIITLANESKVASKGIGQGSFSHSLNLKFMLFIPNCPFNIISSSQLIWSLHCSVTFDVDSFFGQSNDGIAISQKKYALDILKEIGMIDCMLIVINLRIIQQLLVHENQELDCPMDPNKKYKADQGKPYLDPKRYWRLVGKLIYVTTRPDISL
ncbi:hypothetical protein CR513_27671, partial [Mucuna pruriens]